MKLVVTIPAYNEAETIADVIAEVPRAIVGLSSVEVLVVDDGSTDGTADVARAAGADHIVSHRRNRGLAAAFTTAMQDAVVRGADLIVNTDGDNHYDQSRIPDLIRPLLNRQADIAVGSRMLDKLQMPAANKYGNRVANFIMQRLLGLPDVDVSSGYRAYTREAALRLNVFSSHTYTHETLLNALDHRLTIVSVPISARAVERQSRLIKSIPSHVWKAGLVIARAFTLYRPLHVWSALGFLCMFLGAIPFVRFLYFYEQGAGNGHVQSLVAGSVLSFLGVQMFIAGLLASAIARNRSLLEDLVYRWREQEVRRSAAGKQSRANGNGHQEDIRRQVDVA